MVFVIDRSRSIYPPDFQKAKVFVQKVIKLFDPRTSRFAAISFAQGATVEFDLRKYGSDQQATLNAIANLDQVSIDYFIKLRNVHTFQNS